MTVGMHQQGTHILIIILKYESIQIIPESSIYCINAALYILYLCTEHYMGLLQKDAHNKADLEKLPIYVALIQCVQHSQPAA